MGQHLVGRLDRLDPRTGQFTHYRHDPSDPGSLGSNNVQTIYLDRQGELCGHLGCRPMGSIRRQEILSITSRIAADRKSLSSEKIWKIFEDREGVWIGTYGGGLERDHDENRFIQYQHEPLDPASLSHNNVIDIYEDRDGSLWVGTEGGASTSFTANASLSRSSK